MPEYAANAHHIVHKHGGKYLTRTDNIKTVEGEPLDTTLIALLEFPSLAAFEAFAGDPDYAPYAEARRQGSVSRFHLLDSSDLVGTIPYLSGDWVTAGIRRLSMAVFGSGFDRSFPDDAPLTFAAGTAE